MHRNIHHVDVMFVVNVPERDRRALSRCGSYPLVRESDISLLPRTVKESLMARFRSFARTLSRPRG
jgi:hypothetical protein